MSTVTEILGTKYPIICGAMARITTHEIAGAVSEAGGLGILGAGGWSADQLRDEIRQTKAMTDKPFGVNLMLQMDNIPELVDVVIEEGVQVVTTGAGSPEKYLPTLKEAGVKVIPVIAAVKHATKMEKLGVDAVIAEGQEAGGHIGQTSTMSLLPQIVDAVNIPVLGAGGTGDGRSVAAMYALGAQGIQAGTIFLTAEECPVPDSYKQMVLGANDTATIVTGRRNRDPVRTISNDLQLAYYDKEMAGASKEEMAEFATGSLSLAVFEGDTTNGSVMAGEISGMMKQIRPAKQIIEELFSEAEKVAENLKITY